MLTKIKDGKVLECPAEEEAELRAFWSANDPTKRAPEPSQAQKLVSSILADPQALALLKDKLK